MYTILRTVLECSCSEQIPGTTPHCPSINSCESVLHETKSILPLAVGRASLEEGKPLIPASKKIQQALHMV